MQHARRMGWWLAVPVGIALGLALAVGLDRAAEPAAGQGGRSGVTVSAEQLRINQRISQAAVKRSNRANTRLDQLKPAATGPAGPVGPAGPAGPAGPGAGRLAFSGPVGTPVRRVLDLAGVTINAGCEAGASGETTLAINFELAQATTFIGSVTRDGGTDPDAPTVSEVENFEVPLPAGAVPVGGPSSPDGEFVREFARVLFVTPARTVSLDVSLIADGIADRCSFNGVAVPA
jgi:hypothetical protein